MGPSPASRTHEQRKGGNGVKKTYIILFKNKEEGGRKRKRESSMLRQECLRKLQLTDHLQHLKWQKIIIILKMYFADIKHYTYNNNTM
jgi:hypothetical protein